MFDSDSGGIVTAYAVFQGMSPQTDETIQMRRMRTTMGKRLTAEEATHSLAERRALQREGRAEREKMRRQMEKQEKREKEASEKREREASGEKERFWRRLWCFQQRGPIE